MRRAVPLALAALGLLGACRGGSSAPPPRPRTLYLVPAGEEGKAPEGLDAVVAFVEVAADAGTRARGLMGRARLAPDHGMLFIYPDEGVREFWMKNTRIPLSICFARESGRIVRILDMEPGVGVPDELLPRYESGERALYVLEMERGWFRDRGIRTGDRVRLHPRLRAIRAR